VVIVAPRRQDAREIIMRIPKYWAKAEQSGADHRGRPVLFRIWGWSFDSLAEASRHAGARARSICDLVTTGEKRDAYDYLEHPLREEIVQSVGAPGEESAIITRNRYGALVLNCRSVCFADVDHERAGSDGIVAALRCLFSSRRRREKAQASRQATAQRVRDWFHHHPDRSCRVYETAAGLRLLFTDRHYDPVSEEVSRLLVDLGSDALYRRLTLRQECFRARLSPKPWRCGCRQPPNRYPWEHAEDERRYRAWQQAYEAKAQQYAVCRLLEVLGNGPVDEDLAGLVQLHDQYACRPDGVQLA